MLLERRRSCSCSVPGVIILQRRRRAEEEVGEVERRVRSRDLLL